MYSDGERPLAAGVLVDAVDALATLPDGAAALDALTKGDRESARAGSML